MGSYERRWIRFPEMMRAFCSTRTVRALCVPDARDCTNTALKLMVQLGTEAQFKLEDEMFIKTQCVSMRYTLMKYPEQ